MGAIEGAVRANADYLNVVNMEVGAINADIKELEEIIQKYRNVFGVDKIEFEELVRAYGGCPAVSQKFGTVSQKMVRGEIKVCKLSEENCDLKSQDLTRLP